MYEYVYKVVVNYMRERQKKGEKADIKVLEFRVIKGGRRKEGKEEMEKKENESEGCRLPTDV